MFYEFECSNGHVSEDMVPMGTEKIPCPKCAIFNPMVYAYRILSATRTTFVFNDTRKRIRHIQKVAARDP